MTIIIHFIFYIQYIFVQSEINLDFVLDSLVLAMTLH